MKDKMNYIGVFGVFLGLFLSKVLTNKYGDSGRVVFSIIIIIFLVIFFSIILLLKEYMAAIIMSSMLIPTIIGLIGVIIDNMYMVFASIFVFIISALIMLKMIPKLKKKFNK